MAKALYSPFAKSFLKHVSSLTKQNFNLKLELHHRRERQTALEARLDAAEKQIEEQSELQEVNEQLLQELEKRDQAVEEAVGIIVTLEEKVERLMREREVVKNFDSQQNYDSGYFRIVHKDPSGALPNKGESPEKSMARMPSFLSEQSEGAEALRSLYLPHSQSYNEANLPQLQEEAPSDGGINSPRLSVLSESSFVSVYGKKDQSPEAEDNDEAEVQNRHRASSSVEKWVSGRPSATSAGTSTSLQNDARNYLSMNKIMTSPLQRLEKLQETLEKNSLNAAAQLQLVRPTSIQPPRKKRDSLRRVITDKGSFDQQHALPPTPDTISTSTLRHYQNSHDTLGRDAGALTFLNSTSTFRTQASFNAHQAAIPIRPRSAGDTITSKREGHGWDTETQDEFSSDASVLSAEQFRNSNRVPTPDLFSFSDFGRISDNRHADWDRDMMFSNAQPRPSAFNTTSNFNAMGINMPEHENSEDTLRGTLSGLVAPQGTYNLDTFEQPGPPKRRASLTQPSKLRKPNQSSSNGSSGPSVAGTSPSPAKKQGLASRFFGRSDTSPSLSTNTFQRSSVRSPTNPVRTQYFVDDDDSARATPPPIMRNRASAGPRQRPSSAGADSMRDNRANLRRASVFGGGEPVDAAKMEEQNKSSGGRNWLGLKSSSLRRN